MPHIEFFFDFSSPYSYLASTQLEAVARRTGASFEAKPFVLGAVFKGSGNVMPGAVPAKALQMLRDLGAWARLYGVPFRFNPRFPFNAIKAHRMVLAIDDPGQRWRLVQRCFHAFWAEEADLGDEALLRQLLAECGADPEAVFARHESPEVKDRLRANTDDALGRGAYGAPTFFVGEEMFVGNDRLMFVERAARGEPVYVEG
jgi:2-hydroxychromene-2-carboxylate isomerase